MATTQSHPAKAKRPKSPPPSTLPPLLSRAVLSAVTGVSLPGVDKFLQRPHDPLPSMKFGRKILVRREAFLEWCERQATNDGLNGTRRKPRRAKTTRRKAKGKTRRPRAKR